MHHEKAQPRTSCTLSEVPPFCYLRPGMTAEEGALSAIKALEITYPLDSLAILWILRRDIEQSETARKRKST